jgi:hypothetical protein
MKFKEAEKYFEIYRDALRFEAQRLVSYMSIYRNLHERRKDRLNEMNISPAFYQVILDALFTSIVLWTDKLFGEKSERGFVNFLKFSEINHNIFEISELKRRNNYSDKHWMLDREPITLNTIRADMEQLSKIEALPSFKTRRDKFHAHFDKEYFFDRKKISDDAPLKWGDLKEIEETMSSIINRYSTAYDGNIFSIKPTNINDVNRTLNMLHSKKSS